MGNWLRYFSGSRKGRLAVVGIIFFILAFYISLTLFMIFNDAKLDLEKFLYVQKAELPEEAKVTIELERESLILKEQLKTYFLFSKEPGAFEVWLENHLKERNLRLDHADREKILLLKDLKIGTLIDNDCQEKFCFQHKIPFEQIPGKLWKGLIGIEDYRYLDHQGIDYKSLFRALFADIMALKIVQGGSTITQQLVKNIFLSGEKSLKRKIREMIYSIYLEKKFTKEEILAAYFNEIFWGSFQGIKIKGIYMASLFYFSKRPEDLTTYEVSILVGLLKGPIFYNPLQGTEKIRRRANFVQNKLFELNLISRPQKMAIWSDQEWFKWRGDLVRNLEKFTFKEIWRIQEENLPSGPLNDYERFVFADSARKTVMKLQGGAVKAMMGKQVCENGCPKPFFYDSRWVVSDDHAFKHQKHDLGDLMKPAHPAGGSQMGLEEVFNHFQKFFQTYCNLVREIPQEVETAFPEKEGGEGGPTNYSSKNWFVAFDGRELWVLWVNGLTGEASKVYQSFAQFRGKRFSVLGCPMVPILQDGLGK